MYRYMKNIHVVITMLLKGSRYFVCMVMLFAFIACKPKPSEGVRKPHSVAPSYFNNIPADIEGCACYYSSSLKELQRKQYLFVMDAVDSTAYISLGKRIIKLHLVSTTIQPGTFGNHDHINLYKAPMVKVTIDIKYRKPTGEETWLNTGRIYITDSTGGTSKVDITGECGC